MHTFYVLPIGQRDIAGLAFCRAQVHLQPGEAEWIRGESMVGYPHHLFLPEEVHNLETLQTIWGSPIEGLCEKDYEVSFTARLKQTFSLFQAIQVANTTFESINQFTLEDRSRVDLIVTRGPNIAPVLMEFKQPKTLEDAPAHIDQLVTYGMRFFAQHPFVGLLPCLVTDGNRFFVGRFQRASLGDFEYELHEHSHELYDANGRLKLETLQVLLMILYTPNKSLATGLLVNHADDKGKIINSLVNFKYFIACGGTSGVYKVTIGEKSYALKYPSDDCTNDVEREIEILRSLEGTNIIVPVFATVLTGGPFIVSALGCPAKLPLHLPPELEAELRAHGTFSFQHFLEIFGKLKLLHTKGYVHRDLRIDNFILLNHEGFINDVGFAAAIGEDGKTEPCLYKGSLQTGSKTALLNYIAGKVFAYHKIDDIESFYKCFMLWYLQIPFKFLPGVSRSAQAAELWNAMLPVSPFSSFSSDYDACCDFVENHIKECRDGLERVLATQADVFRRL